MPPRIATPASRALPFSKACGMISRKAAPSSAPIANDTSIGIQDARRVSANAAAAAESVPPATLAARIQPRVMGGGFYVSQMSAAMRPVLASRRYEKKRAASEYVQKLPP